MSTAVGFIAELLVYLAIYGIMTLGLNIQYGFTGLLNFMFFVFAGLGGYVYAVSVLGRPAASNGAMYILGLGLPFPAALLLAGLVTGLVGWLIGFIALRRLSGDFMGIVLVSTGLVMSNFVYNYVPLFNGANGLSDIPQPYFDVLNLDINAYGLFFVALAGFVALLCWIVAQRIDRSPLGRLMRATRDDLEACESVGKNTFAIRMTAMAIGCIYAGIGGALLVAYDTTIGPSSWTTTETFVIWTALMLGGSGNNWGALFGTFVFLDVLGQPTLLLPTIANHPNLVAAGRYVLIGATLVLVLRFRPQGILPERRPTTERLLGPYRWHARDARTAGERE